MNCKECKEARRNNERKYNAEINAAFLERANKRQFWIILLLIIALVGTNAFWIHRETQFEDVYQEVIQDAENGENNFIGGDSYGSADNQD